MKIIFSGHGQIPTLEQDAMYAREHRVLALAQNLAEKGHEVVTVSIKKSLRTTTSKYKNIQILNKSLPSFLRMIWKEQPDVLHIYSWKLSALGWLYALLSPNTTYIWTIDKLPSRWKLISKLVAWQGRIVFDVVTVPSRHMQYTIRYTYKLATTYLPDGYATSDVAEISLNHFGVRKGQYILAVANGVEDITWLAEAYKLSRTRKPLLVLVPGISGHMKVSRRFPVMRVMPLPGERGLRTLVRHTAAVVALSMATPLSLILEAMDSERAVISVTHPLLEETLGVAAQYFKAGDAVGFKLALNKVAPSRKSQLIWGREAAKRAKAHFLWERIIPEYMKLYTGQKNVHVPLDSIVTKFDIVKTAS